MRTRAAQIDHLQVGTRIGQSYVARVVVYSQLCVSDDL